MSSPSVSIAPVRSPEDLQETIRLFTVYATSLGIDLSFQSFDSEMAGMPGKYSPESGGELFLARSTATGEAVGCVGLRALPGSPSSTEKIAMATKSQQQQANEARCCEMKRLYVSPSGRGLGLGRLLVQAVVAKARELGYTEISLDTLPSMTAALGLYEKMGFVQIEKYYETPIADTRFLGLRLRG